MTFTGVGQQGMPVPRSRVDSRYRHLFAGERLGFDASSSFHSEMTWPSPYSASTAALASSGDPAGTLSRMPAWSSTHMNPTYALGVSSGWLTFIRHRLAPLYVKAPVLMSVVALLMGPESG